MKKYRSLIIVLVLGILVWTIGPKIVGLEQSILLLKEVNLVFLFLAIIVEALSYVVAGWLLKIIAKKIGNFAFRFWDLLRISLLDVFSIQVLPFAGAGQATINIYFFRSFKISFSKSMAIFITQLMFLYLAFISLFLLGLVSAPIHPELSSLQRNVLWIAFAVVFFLLAFFIIISKWRQVFMNIVKFFLNAANRFVDLVFHREIVTEDHADLIAHEFHQGVQFFRKRKKMSLGITGVAVLYWLGDAACLFFSFMAFGQFIHPGILIAAYCIAVLLGIASFIPGGIGVKESVLVLIFIGFSVPSDIAIMAVLLYRLLSFWLIIPVGLASYLSLEKDKKKIEQNLNQEGIQPNRP